MDIVKRKHVSPYYTETGVLKKPKEVGRPRKSKLEKDDCILCLGQGEVIDAKSQEMRKCCCCNGTGKIKI